MRLDFFRVNIFSGTQDDDFLFSSGDEQVVALIQVAEITSLQPAIFDGIGRSVRTVVITFHHNVAGNRDLTCLIIAALLRLRINNPDLHAFERHTH